jgi:hypothetical protein
MAGQQKLFKEFGSVYVSQVITLTMHIKFWHQHCIQKDLKDLALWRYANPGSSVLWVDALTTMPRPHPWPASILVHSVLT